MMNGTIDQQSGSVRVSVDAGKSEDGMEGKGSKRPTDRNEVKRTKNEGLNWAQHI